LGGFLCNFYFEIELFRKWRTNDSCARDDYFVTHLAWTGLKNGRIKLKGSIFSPLFHRHLSFFTAAAAARLL
jgi:hypothetical protein